MISRIYSIHSFLQGTIELKLCKNWKSQLDPKTKKKNQPQNKIKRMIQPKDQCSRVSLTTLLRNQETRRTEKRLITIILISLRMVRVQHQSKLTRSFLGLKKRKPRIRLRLITKNCHKMMVILLAVRTLKDLNNATSSLLTWTTTKCFRMSLWREFLGWTNLKLII